MKNSHNPMRSWTKGLAAMREALRCGAKTRSGEPCKGPAMRNGRCRMHGAREQADLVYMAVTARRR